MNATCPALATGIWANYGARAIGRLGMTLRALESGGDTTLSLVGLGHWAGVIT